jgi:autonomous glycyl radical cofactor GrcA
MPWLEIDLEERRRCITTQNGQKRDINAAVVQLPHIASPITLSAQPDVRVHYVSHLTASTMRT